MEDPVKMTEQGIRDLKKDLQGAMTSLAEVKGIAIRTRKDATNRKKAAADYEKKAMLLLQKGAAGGMDSAEAERLAADALGRKASADSEGARLDNEAMGHEKMAEGLSANVNKIKSTVTSYENDLVTLKARARTASSTKKINAQLARIDSSGTISMLEKMKERVDEEESLAVAYGEMATQSTGVDEDIDKALQAGENPQISDQLEAMKKKMGITA